MTLRYSKQLPPRISFIQLTLSIDKIFDNDKRGFLEWLPQTTFTGF